MDERCVKFATDAAQRPTDAKLIATLRKFLFRNQEQRLSAASQQALCDACVRHAAAAGVEAIGLVEDSLAMPFNIFTTGHKKQLLKHLDRLRGLEGGGGGTGGAPQAGANANPDNARECAVMDVTADGSVIELMDDDGETATVAEVGEEDAAAIREAFDKGEEVRVRAVFVEAAAAAKAKAKKGGDSAAAATARVLGIVGR